MLQDLSHMDRITQLQDEIQRVTLSFDPCIQTTADSETTAPRNHVQQHRLPHHPVHLPSTQRTDTHHQTAQPRQVRPARCLRRCARLVFPTPDIDNAQANKKELVDDLIMKAKQIEVLIQSLPVPEPEEQQVCTLECVITCYLTRLLSGKSAAGIGR